MSGIFGNAVGTTAPRANLLQEDNTKPDFVRGKEIIDEKIREALVEAGAGVAGKDGATFTPSVDAAGNLSWTNNGGLPNPDTVNIKGADGENGADGYTPVKGTDYYTDADKDELTGLVLDTFATPAGITFSKVGSTVTATFSEADGVDETVTVQLDAYDRPLWLAHGDRTCYFSWEGFD